jgi:hypothetical protein
MEGLAKQISSDWIDLRECGSDLQAIYVFLAPHPRFMRAHVEALHGSVEGGVVEYKGGCLRKVAQAMEEARYRTIDAEELKRLYQETTVLLLVVSIQRLIAHGDIRVRQKPRGEAELPEQDVKALIQDVQERVKKQPDLARHPSVQHLSVQVRKYRRELETMKKLAPTMPQDKRAGFYANFKNSFAQIVQAIKRDYAELIAEIEPQQQRESSPLTWVPLAKLVKELERQAQGISEVRSTLEYARTERYKIRDILVDLREKAEALTDRFDAELASYETYAGSPRNARLVSRAFGREAIRVLMRSMPELPQGDATGTG